MLNFLAFLHILCSVTKSDVAGRQLISRFLKCRRTKGPNALSMKSWGCVVDIFSVFGATYDFQRPDSSPYRELRAIQENCPSSLGHLSRRSGCGACIY